MTSDNRPFSYHTQFYQDAASHPVGATGVAQIVEIVMQLRGDADKRQIKDAKIGLAHNVGGSGATCTVHIMEAI